MSRNKEIIKDLIDTIDTIKKQHPTHLGESLDQLNTLVLLFESLEHHVKKELEDDKAA